MNDPIKPRGFAALTPERRKEIAAAGGLAAHRSGNAHEFSSEEAREAGKKRHQAKRRAATSGLGLAARTVDSSDGSAT